MRYSSDLYPLDQMFKVDVLKKANNFGALFNRVQFIQHLIVLVSSYESSNESLLYCV